MRFWVGITDVEWFRFLRERGDPDDVNFWQPSDRRPVQLEPGSPFLFKLHARDGGFLVGGGWLIRYKRMSPREAWDVFGTSNGAASSQAMLQRIERYRRSRIDPELDSIGCTVLTQPYLYRRAAWIAPPTDWAPNIVQGRTYDTSEPLGARLWASHLASLAAASTASLDEIEARYGSPIEVSTRLGQSGFRLLVLDAYERRCAMTGERTVPVLDAAHIKPYAADGPHRVENGLLLRKDLHALLDRGYLTVTPEYSVMVSRTIREELENGRDYYALHGSVISLPNGFPPPERQYLQGHNDTVFRG